jgi:hypothetical protein
MSPKYGNDDAAPPANAAGQVGGRSETSDQFIERMIDEGASPEAAKQAAAGHFELDMYRVQPGELLPGWTAQRWQAATFVMLGCFLAVLISVFFTAPAFHPTEPATEARLWAPIFLATFFPIIVLMFSSGIAGVAKAGKESSNGYTTLRWLTRSPIEIRDSRGRLILPGDKRLTSSAKYMHAFIMIGSACAVISPLLWILRLVAQ